MNRYEQQFLDALRDIFVGARVEGESGYINLMKIKARYFEMGVLPRLQADIDAACASFEPSFREELFDKLYDFFKRYFSESGSIYFRSTPLHERVYEKVYTDDRDVMLFWKTHMLYYVKTDRLFNSMDVSVEDNAFYFDVSQLQHKRANEKRELLYTFQELRDGKIVLRVDYSEKGRKTKADEILKELKTRGVKLDEEVLTRAIRVFEKQSEVDYFINKNAKAFLREQFDLWLFQYVFGDESRWTETRLQQLQALKRIAYNLIDFIAQFEDELVRVWNKPKFVLNSHYVVTIDKVLGDGGQGTGDFVIASGATQSQRAEEEIASGDTLRRARNDILKRLFEHAGMDAQVKEWRELGMVDEKFAPEQILEKDLTGYPKFPQYQFLPLDTKYFPDLELDILSLFEDLDAELDGWLVHSENYQALNTLQNKFREKVQAIYIDPPYNTDASEIIYANNYKHASWMTLIENRLDVAKRYLKKEGILCVTIDHIEVAPLKSLTEFVFGSDTQLGLVCIKNNPSGRSTVKGFSIANEYAIFVGATDEANIGTVPRTEEQIAQYDEVDEKGNFQWRNFMRSGGQNDFRQERPRLYYPLFVSQSAARIPKMEWDAANESWTLQEKPKRTEQIFYPIGESGTEYTWRLGLETLKQRFKDLRVRTNKQGKLTLEVKFRLEDDGVLPKTVWDNSLFNATAYGTSLLRGLFGTSQLFSFPKSVYAVEEAIRVCRTRSEDIVVDFFGGSGTTAHAVINLNREDGGKRKYILVEMGEHFNTVILPRVKKVVFSDKWKDGKAQQGKGISHFAKYYELEQYEDTLKRAQYADSDLFSAAADPYTSYVFLRDLKLLDSVALDKPNNQVKVNLENIYAGIDVAETLSNVTGKPIKRITRDTVEFQDGTTASLTNPEWGMIKALVWW